MSNALEDAFPVVNSGKYTRQKEAWKFAKSPFCDYGKAKIMFVLQGKIEGKAHPVKIFC